MTDQSKGEERNRWGYTTEEMEVIKSQVARGATDLQLALFLSWCKIKGMDAMAKQAHFDLKNTKCKVCRAEFPEANTCPHCKKGWSLVPVFIEGIDGLLARAQDWPGYENIYGAVVCANDDFLFDAMAQVPVKHIFGPVRGPVLGAWSQIRFTDGRPPVTYWYSLSEYNTEGPVTKEKKGVMLLKSCMSILLRRQYPRPYQAGLSYIKEEFGKVAQIPAPEFEQRHAELEKEMAQAGVVVMDEVEATPFDEVAEETAKIVADTPVVETALADGAELVSTSGPSPIVPQQKMPDTYEVGVLTYRQVGDVVEVQLEGVKEPVWKLANELIHSEAHPFGMKSYERALALFKKGDWELKGHMMKHFGKATLRALTWEEFAALLQHKKYGRSDQRWYTEAPVPVMKDSDYASMVDFYQLKLETLTPDQKDFFALVGKLAQPGCLQYLLGQGWTWEANTVEFLGVAAMLVDGTFEYGDQDYRQVVDDVKRNSSNQPA